VEVGYLARKWKILFVLQKTHVFKILQSKQISKYSEVVVKTSHTNDEVFLGRRREGDERNGYFSHCLTFFQCLHFKHNVTVNRRKINAKSSPITGDYCNQLSGALYLFPRRRKNWIMKKT